MDTSSLPKGFISVEDAVKLINTNTFDKPTVDIKYLIGHKDWIEIAHNFRIPKVRLATKEEVMDEMKRRPGRRPSELIVLENVYVTLRTAFEVEYLKKTIRDNYAGIVGHEYKEIHTRGMTSVIDQESGASHIPRRTKKTVAKEGDEIGSSSVMSTNSADGAGA